MSKLQHTPGPWAKCHANNDKCSCGLIWDNTGCFVIASVTSTCKEHESSNLGEGMNRGSNEFLANARLIAAAPEMLKELIDFCAYNCTDCSGHIEGCSETCGLKNAKAIIEKATGMSIEEILK